MSSSNNTNKTNVPEAKEAMNRFKMEVANEIGVPLSEGYNGPPHRLVPSAAIWSKR